jgi:hypothetical protein
MRTNDRFGRSDVVLLWLVPGINTKTLCHGVSLVRMTNGRKQFSSRSLVGEHTKKKSSQKITRTD